jgi:hypothetical protein
MKVVDLICDYTTSSVRTLSNSADAARVQRYEQRVLSNRPPSTPSQKTLPTHPQGAQDVRWIFIY